jgi:hypothetical protein
LDGRINVIIESKSKAVARIIVFIFITDGILFIITALMCWLLNRFTLNGFSTILFLSGFLTILIGMLFGGDRELVPPRMLGVDIGSMIPNVKNNVLKGPRGFLLTAVVAGSIAIAVSILIPLILSR